ncbi:MAG: hypothetical protein ABGZ35_08235 [Planctomycetaceae bacterium]
MKAELDEMAHGAKPPGAIEIPVSQIHRRAEADFHIIAILNDWHVKDSKLSTDTPIGLRVCARRLKDRYSAGTRYQVERFFNEKFPLGRKNKGHSLYAEMCDSHDVSAIRKWLNNLDATDLAIQMATAGDVVSTDIDPNPDRRDGPKCDHCDNAISAHEAEEWGTCEQHRNLAGTV